MNVLISAFACRPGYGSEPGVGWNWVMGLSNYHNVYLLTSIENKPYIENGLKESKVKINVEYCDLFWVRKLTKGFPFALNIYCNVWQKVIKKKVKLMHEKINFDLCHHVTYASFKYPSYLYELGIPFVFGPVGGGEKTPKNLLSIYNRKNVIKEILRNIQIDKIGKRKAISKTLEGASKILVTTEETKQCIPQKYYNKVEIMQTIGIEAINIKSRKKEGNVGVLRLLFVGEIKQIKGIYFFIQMAKRFKINHYKYNYIFEIVGDGPDMEWFKKEIKDNELEEYFILNGWMERELVLNKYSECDIFVYPGLHDSGAMVILEAMINKLPVVCLGTGGPNVNVSNNNGFKVNPQLSINEIVTSFIEEIESVKEKIISGAIDEIILNALETTIKDNLWENKIKKMNSIYMDVVK